MLLSTLCPVYSDTKGKQLKASTLQGARALLSKTARAHAPDEHARAGIKQGLSIAATLVLIALAMLQVAVWVEIRLHS